MACCHIYSTWYTGCETPCLLAAQTPLLAAKETIVVLSCATSFGLLQPSGTDFEVLGRNLKASVYPLRGVCTMQRFLLKQSL